MDIELYQIISLPFMQRAFISCIALSIVLGILGTFIVPRKMAFMADGISHGSLVGVSVGILLGIFPLMLAIIAAIVMGTLVAALRSNRRITQDGLIGILLTGGMSSAIIIFSLVPGYKPEIFSYLFGSVLSTTWIEVYILLGFSIITLVLAKYLWRALILTTIHDQLGRVMNLPTTFANYFLFVFTAIALVTGVKLLGIILVSAMLIVPVLSSSLLSNSLKSSVIVTITIGLISSIIGLFVSFVADLPSGPCIALTLIGFFIASFVVSILLPNRKNY
jgi:zinc transport system permease protein